MINLPVALFVVNVSINLPVALSVISISASTGFFVIWSIVTPLNTVNDFLFTSTVASIELSLIGFTIDARR